MSTPEANLQAEPALKPRFLPKLLVASLLSALAATECLVAYVLVPSADQVAAMADARADEQKKKAEEEARHEEWQTGGEEVVEVELGQPYSITSHQPASNMTLRIDFDLFATVGPKDKAEFEHLFATHEHRLRDTVIFEIRNAELTDLTDPGLGLIKRRILEKSNALFGKPILRSVVFPQFSYVEQ